MRRWFLSYNSQDLALVQGVAAALRSRDAGAGIFFAPTSLRAGGFWLPELAKEIAEATAFVLLVGEKGLGAWQVMEYYEAIDRRVKEKGFAVVLMLLDGQPAPGLPFLRQLHWIVTKDLTSEKSLAQLVDAASGGGSPPGELWRHTAPYRGLAAMTEADSDFFFGRTAESVQVINALATDPDRLCILLGNSGVGKSSLAQAGVLGAFARQAWPEGSNVNEPWPAAFADSRRWCVLKLRPGTEPIRSLVEPFIRCWQFDPTDPRREQRQTEWIESLSTGRGTLKGLLDATVDRLRELGQPEPPHFLLYIDQGEELYVRAEEQERRRFSDIFAGSFGDPRLRAMMSLRSDFLGALQADEPLFDAHHKIDVTPLRETQLIDVVSKPAALLSARFETRSLAGDIARRTAEDSTKDAGALPMLSYLLDDMWAQMIARGDGVLRLPPQAIEPGGVLAERANAFLATHPAAEAALRRVLILRLANVRSDGAVTRRRALRSEFSAEEWKLVSELADHPNRLLVIAAPDDGETYAEVAHEAVFRRWEKLKEWIAGEREFLAWKTGLEAARRSWEATPDNAKHEALLMGLALAQAQSWLAKRPADIAPADAGFVALSRRTAQWRRRRVQALVGVLVAVMVAGLAAWMNEQWVKEHMYWFMHVRGKVHTAAKLRTLPPFQPFKDCDGCPEMIVIPAGKFMMGSPNTEKGSFDNEGPMHEVVLKQPFAVGRFELTFDDWDVCAAHGDCNARVGDPRWGRGRQPVVAITWEEAKGYVAWLSRITGQNYRLLSEAEWEYAARAGTTTPYHWGVDIGKGNANCTGCGAEGGGVQPMRVGLFAPNAFGLYDMHGNLREWVEDCYQKTYKGAPADGSPSTEECTNRVVRGGSWFDKPEELRAAYRTSYVPTARFIDLGLRVARSIDR
jgi:formylglycine-generating enzyme required for sulfatase activity